MKRFNGFLNECLYKFRYGALMLAVGLIVSIWDLVTKAVTDGKNATLIDGVVSIFSTHNTGAAWSMFSNLTWLLILLSIIFIGVLIAANYVYKNKTALYSFAFGFILSGAICNLYDRVVYGYVRDFISLDFINFPVFNLADCAITVGVILMVVHFIVDYFATKQKANTLTETKNDQTLEEKQQNLTNNAEKNEYTKDSTKYIIKKSGKTAKNGHKSNKEKNVKQEKSSNQKRSLTRIKNKDNV